MEMFRIFPVQYLVAIRHVLTTACLNVAEELNF